MILKMKREKRPSFCFPVQISDNGFFYSLNTSYTQRVSADYHVHSKVVNVVGEQPAEGIPHLLFLKS